MSAYALSLEGRAMACLVNIAPANGDRSPEALRRARSACAEALRYWRAENDRARARWLRDHISQVGYPMTNAQFRGSANRHAAWKRRYSRKHPKT